MYDITDQDTFENVGKWLRAFRGHADANVVVMLVGNKCDLHHLRTVDTGEAMKYAGRLGDVEGRVERVKEQSCHP